MDAQDGTLRNEHCEPKRDALIVRFRCHIARSSNRNAARNAIIHSRSQALHKGVAKGTSSCASDAKNQRTVRDEGGQP